MAFTLDGWEAGAVARGTVFRISTASGCGTGGSARTSWWTAWPTAGARRSGPRARHRRRARRPAAVRARRAIRGRGRGGAGPRTARGRDWPLWRYRGGSAAHRPYRGPHHHDDFRLTSAGPARPPPRRPTSPRGTSQHCGGPVQVRAERDQWLLDVAVPCGSGPGPRRRPARCTGTPRRRSPLRAALCGRTCAPVRPRSGSRSRRWRGYGAQVAQVAQPWPPRAASCRPGSPEVGHLEREPGRRGGRVGPDVQRPGGELGEQCAQVGRSPESLQSANIVPTWTPAAPAAGPRRPCPAFRRNRPARTAAQLGQAGEVRIVARAVDRSRRLVEHHLAARRSVMAAGDGALR